MHQHDASGAGANAPPNDEAHGSPQSAGPSNNQTLYLNPTVKLVPSQALPEAISIFARLSQQFSLLGLSLYPLDEKAVLVSSHRLGMSRTFPDLRSAQIYLRQIGGVR
ncbi:MAG TPA: hypothetical protein PLL01_09125 [Rhodoferax sp.]|jgi:hypothetical protein|nr:hypothetical protein [Rhodoferax sp.]